MFWFVANLIFAVLNFGLWLWLDTPWNLFSSGFSCAACFVLMWPLFE